MTDRSAFGWVKPQHFTIGQVAFAWWVGMLVGILLVTPFYRVSPPACEIQTRDTTWFAENANGIPIQKLTEITRCHAWKGDG